MTVRRPLALLALAVLAAACGDDGGTADDAAPTDAAPAAGPATTEAAADDGTTAGGPITLDAATGSVTLQAPAERIVALEWDVAEHLLALGVTPVGVADAAGYGDWLASELPADVVDVGTRQEPSLESIAALEPDLIVGVDFRHATTAEQLDAIAPTLLLTPYPEPEAGSELEAMREAVRTLGTAIGDAAAAERVLADLDAALAEAAQRIADAGLDGAEVALAQGFSSEGAPQIRMFTDNARPVELLGAVGLQNGWDGPSEAFGFNTVDAEGLTALGDVRFLYVAQPDDDIFADVLADNPVWSSLPFVASGNVRNLGADTWFWGGPQSAEVFVDRVVDQLTGS